MFAILALAIAASSVVYLWTYRAQYFHLGTQNYGPGDGEWLVEAPEVHGLDSAALDAAAARVGERLQQRDCLVIVKDGVVIHETYYNGATKDSMHYLSSAGKTAVALVIGAAVRAGVISLDTPLIDYGVVAPDSDNTPRTSLGTALPVGGGGGSPAFSKHATSNVNWGGSWSQVTTRHLLAQVTGRGNAEAGTTFDDDGDGVVLGALSRLLRSATGESPSTWARKHLTGPLGVPDFFEHDDLRGHISAAGGQMATCRDAARFGQLIVNEGMWLANDGTVLTLVDPWFVRQLTHASFPNANQQYGYLTWLHPGKTTEGKPRPRNADGALGDVTVLTGAKAPLEWSEFKCCGTSWGCDGQDTGRGWESQSQRQHGGKGTAAKGVKLGRPLLGSEGPNFPLVMAMGLLGKFIISAPEQRLVVVTMGNTWGTSRDCPANLDPTADAKHRWPGALGGDKGMIGYDESTTVRALWSAIGEAVTTPSTPRAAVGPSLVSPDVTAGGGSSGATYGDDSMGDEESLLAAEDASERHSAWETLRASDVVEAGNAELGAEVVTRRRAASASTAVNVADRVASGGSGHDAAEGVKAAAGHVGACYCHCPPHNAIGQCVNMRDVPEARCDARELLSGAAGFCPSVGVLSECTADTFKGGQGAETLHQLSTVNTPFNVPARRFEVYRQLSVATDAAEFACSVTSKCSNGFEGSSASYMCSPLSFHSCVWDAKPCEESPYYATRNATAKDTRGALGLRHLALTLPSTPSYVGLRATGSRWDRVAGGVVRRIHQTRAVVAGLTLLATVMAAVAVQVARGKGTSDEDLDGRIDDGDNGGADTSGGGGEGLSRSGDGAVPTDLESAMFAKLGRQAYGATSAQEPSADVRIEEEDNPFK